MKKLCKQLAALVLSVMLLAALCIPALATSTPSDKDETPHQINEDSTATVVVGVTGSEAAANGVDDLLVYKVIAITYDEAANKLTYEFTKLFNAFLASEDNTTELPEGNTSWTPKAYGELGDDTAALKELLGNFTAYIKKNNVEPVAGVDYKGTTDKNGMLKLSDVAMGQYIIVGDGSSNGAKIYQTVTAEVNPVVVDGYPCLYTSYDVSMKTFTPSIGKDITDGTVEDENLTGKGNNDTASIGDTVKYKLTIGIPTYPAGSTNKTFFLGDTLSKGLTLDEGSIVVTGYTDVAAVNGVQLEEGTAYETSLAPVIVDENITGNTLYIDFYFDAIEAGAYKVVTVTYEATVNENAVLGTVDGNPNNVELIYSNSPFDDITWMPNPDKPNDPTRPNDGTDGYGNRKDEEIVYTYALVIDKFEENHENVKLAGAIFKLYQSYSNGVYSDPVMYTKKDGTTDQVTLETDDNGVAAYKGLKAGTYYLEEIKAPDGYNLLQEPVVVTINASNIPFTTEKKTTLTHYTYTTNAEDAMGGNATQATLNGVLVWMNDKGEVKTADAMPEGYSIAYIKDILKEVTNVTEIADGGAGSGYYMTGVANAKGAQLPSTGGVGTTIFYIVGGCLVLGAVILLITKRRMGGTED